MKPKLDDVHRAFMDYQRESIRITNQIAFDANIAKLRKRLKELGLEEHIDWNTDETDQSRA